MRDYREVRKRFIALALASMLIGMNMQNIMAIATDDDACGEFVDKYTYDYSGDSPILMSDLPDGICDNCGYVEAAHATPFVSLLSNDDELEAATYQEESVLDETETTEAESNIEESQDTNSLETTTDEHVDADQDGYCDVCGAYIQPVEYSDEVLATDFECTEHVDNDYDGYCDVCAAYIGLEVVCQNHVDEDNDGYCDNCGYYVGVDDSEEVEECIEHVDADGDNYCDNCGAYIEPEECLEHIDADLDGYCDKCAEFIGIPLCNDGEDIDEDKDGYCDICGKYIGIEEQEAYILIGQSYSKTIAGKTVTVSGFMPEGATVEIKSISNRFVENIINGQLVNEEFDVEEAYDITIYDKDGNEYQPMDDGNTIQVKFSNPSGDELEVIRVNDDYTITELETIDMGSSVVVEAEHFTYYATGSKASTQTYNQETIDDGDAIATVGTTGASGYTYVNKLSIRAYLVADETLSVKVHIYSGLSTTDLTNITGFETTATLANGFDSWDAYTATETGWHQIDITMPQDNPNMYITPNTNYAIVVDLYDDSGSATIATGVGTSTSYVKDDSDGTYTSTTAGMISYDTNTAASLSENITAVAISSTNNRYAGDTLYYDKDDIGTLTDEVISASYTIGGTSGIKRTTTWTSSNTSIVTIDLSTGAINLVQCGSATITADYGSGTKDITVYVMDIQLDSTSIASYSPTYDGAVHPTSVTCSGISATVTYQNGNTTGYTDAGTNLPITLTFSTGYQITKYFTIKQATLDSSKFSGATFTVDEDNYVTACSVSDYTYGEDNDFIVVDSNGEEKPKSITYGTSGIVYTYTVKGVNNYSGSFDVTETKKGNINDDEVGFNVTWKNGDSNFIYTGSAIQLDADASTDGIQITDQLLEDNFTFEFDGTQTTILASDIESITYDENNWINAGTNTGTLYIALKGYSGTYALAYSIEKKNLANNQSTTNNIVYTWKDGSAQSVKKSYAHTGESLKETIAADIVATYNGVELVYGKDYDLTFVSDPPTDNGDYTVTLKGKNGNYTGKSSAFSFEIVESYSNDSVFYVNKSSTAIENKGDSGASIKYTGQVWEPYFQLTVGGVTNTNYNAYYFDEDKFDTSYTASDITTAATASDHITADVGKKYIVVVDKTDTTNIAWVTYSIEQRLMSGVTITLASSSLTYNTKAQEPAVTLTCSETYYNSAGTRTKTTFTLPNTEFDIAYTNNTDVGTATVSINGDGGNVQALTTPKTKTFTITPLVIADSDGNLASYMSATWHGVDSADLVYDTTDKKPTVTLTYTTASVTIPTTDYTYTYDSDCASAGTHTVKITPTLNSNNLYNISTTYTYKYSYTITKKTVAASDLAITLSDGTNSYDVSYDNTNNVYYCEGYNPTYSGSAYKPTVVIKDKNITTGSNVLAQTTIYKVSYPNTSDRVNACALSSTHTSNAYIKISNGTSGSYDFGTSGILIYFGIAQLDISSSSISESGTVYQYDYNNGAAITPTVVLTLGAKTLVENTDYTLSTAGSTSGSYSTENDPANPLVVTAVSGSNYTGTRYINYEIGYGIEENFAKFYLQNPYTAETTSAVTKYANVAASSFEMPVLLKTENGSTTYTTPKPVVQITKNDTSYTLTTSDYDITYTSTYTQSGGYDIYNAHYNGANGLNKVTATITGKGGYYGTLTYTYTIDAIDIASLKVSEYTPKSTDTIYATVTDPNWYTTDAAGTSTGGFDYPGKGNTVDITSSLDIELYYASNAVVQSNYKLEYGTDFTLDPTNIGPDIGKYSVALKAVSDSNFYMSTSWSDVYANSRYRIIAADISSADLSINTSSETNFIAEAQGTDPETYVYKAYYKNGSQIKLNNDENLIVKQNGVTLEMDTDYTITYGSNKTKGTTGTITVTGKGNYTGTATLSFTIIARDLSSGDLTAAAQPVDYTGYVAEPSSWTVVYNGTTTLTSGTNYTVANASTKNANSSTGHDDDGNPYAGTNILPGLGTATGSYSTDDKYVTIIGTGDYSGNLQAKYDIVINLSDINTKQSDLVYVSSKKDSTGTYPILRLTRSQSANTYITNSSVDTVKYGYKVGETPTFKLEYYNVSTSKYVEVGTDNFTTNIASVNTTVGDHDIIITGKYDGTSTGGIVKGSFTFSDVRFLADISEVTGLAPATSVFDYDGTAHSTTVTGLLGTEGASGDYQYSSVTPTDTATAGPKVINITVPDTSQYYIPGTTTTVTYYVKYNLSSPYDIYVTCDGTKTSAIDWTNTAHSLDVEAKWYSTQTDAVALSGVKTSSNTNVFTVSPTTATNINNYTVSVVANESDYAYGVANLSFKINGKTLSTYATDTTIVLSTSLINYTGTQDEYYWIGSDVKPAVTIDGLTQNTDYKVVEYGNCKDVSTSTVKAYVTLEGINNYSGTATKYYTIKAVPITGKINGTSTPLVTITTSNATYLGYNAVVYSDPENQTGGRDYPLPGVTAVYNITGNTLEEGTDYTVNVSSTSAKQAGSSGSATISGVGNFTETSASVSYSVDKLDLSKVGAHLARNYDYYTENEIDPYTIVTVTYTIDDNEIVLEPKVDYTLSVTSLTASSTTLKDKGIYNIVVTGITNCTGTITESFEIKERSIAGNCINNTGSITVSVDDIETVDTKGTEHPLDTTETNATYGTHTVKATNGTYSGIVIKDSGIGSYTSANPYVLIEGKDYTVTYYNNTAAAKKVLTTSTDDFGNYLPDTSTSPYVVITGMGNYSSDQLLIGFNLGKDLSSDTGLSVAMSSSDAAITYDGASHKPTPIVKYNGNTVASTYYDLTYTDADGNEDFVNVGTKTITVTFKGKYYGTKTVDYYIEKRNIGRPGIDGSDTVTVELDFSATGTTDSGKLSTTKAQSLFSSIDYAGYIGMYYCQWPGSYTNNDSAVEPVVTVTDSTLMANKVLTQDTDYTVTFTNNTSATDLTSVTTAKVTINVCGDNFENDPDTARTQEFIITPNDIKNGKITVVFEAGDDTGRLYKWTGDEISVYHSPETQNISVYYEQDHPLTLGTDYDIEYVDNNVAPGYVNINIIGEGNYTGTIADYFTITGDLDDASLVTYNSDGSYEVISDSNQQNLFYTGDYVTPSFGDVYGLVFVANDGISNYECVYEDSGDSNDYAISNIVGDKLTYETVSLTGTGEYVAGSKDITFGIDKNVSALVLSGYSDSYQYTGYDINPTLTLISPSGYDTRQIATDYVATYTKVDSDGNAITGTVVYSQESPSSDGEWVYSGMSESDQETFFTDIGTISVSVTCLVFDYSVTRTASYTIEPRKLSSCIVTYTSVSRYTGKAISPTMAVYVSSSGKLYKLSSSDYNVSYSNNVNPGVNTASFTISSNNSNISTANTVTKRFTIKPGNCSRAKITAKTDTTMTVSWVKDIYSTGTRLQIYKSGSSTPIATTYATGTKQTFTGLSSGTVYTVKFSSYVVGDFNEDGTNERVVSSDSISVSSSTELADITLSAVSKSSGAITLSWTTNDDLESVLIYVSTDNKNFTQKAKIPASDGSVTFTGLTSGQAYYYYLVGGVIVDGEVVWDNATDSDKRTSNVVNVTAK